MKSNELFDTQDKMSCDDYPLPSEIFVYRRSGLKFKGLKYYRFPTTTEAIEFAIKEFSTLRSGDLVLTVGDKRFNLGTLRTLHQKTKERARSSTAEPVAP